MDDWEVERLRENYVAAKAINEPDAGLILVAHHLDVHNELMVGIHRELRELRKQLSKRTRP